MIKIGILPTYNKNDDRPFLHSFSFVNNYAYRVLKNGGIAYGILFPNGVFNENVLEGFDGFIIPGGSNIRLYHLLTVHYSIIHNKPLLGICMGMQVLGIYDNIVFELKCRCLKINYENISKVFLENGENAYLIRINGHNKEEVFYNFSINKAKHEVILLDNTILKSIYKVPILEVVSIHNYVIEGVYGEFRVNSISLDGLPEGLEHKKLFILGVQFHVEMEDKNDILFKRFIYECFMRSKIKLI